MGTLTNLQTLTNLRIQINLQKDLAKRLPVSLSDGTLVQSRTLLHVDLDDITVTDKQPLLIYTTF